MNNQIKSLIQLADWFKEHQRILPWREDSSIYRVWISEIMLQQTQVSTVIPYFERFIAEFPDVVSLARASEETVLKLWAGLGYYSRARNLHKTARIIAENGFPQDRTGWINLPGIGEYTAGAVLSIALNKPEPILDANVKRILSRIYLLDINKANKSIFWEKSAEWVRKAYEHEIEPRIFNQALMELGALICLPDKPKCPECSFKDFCKAFRSGNPGKKGRLKQKEWIYQEESLYALIFNESILLYRNPNAQWRKGLYDLPSQIPSFFCNYKNFSTFKIQTVVTNHRILLHVQILQAENLEAPCPENYFLFKINDIINPLVGITSPAKKIIVKLKFMLGIK